MWRRQFASNSFPPVNLTSLALLYKDLVHGSQLNLLSLVCQGSVTVNVQTKQLLLDADRELLQILVVVTAKLQQLGDLQILKLILSKI